MVNTSPQAAFVSYVTVHGIQAVHYKVAEKEGREVGEVVKG